MEVYAHSVETVCCLLSVSGIYGIWFYDKDECRKLGELMNRYALTLFILLVFFVQKMLTTYKVSK